MSKVRTNEVEALDPNDYVRVEKLSVGEMIQENQTYTASITWDSTDDTYYRDGELVTGATPTVVTPIHKAMRRCLVAPNGTLISYLRNTDSTKLESGAAADLQPALAAHNVMVEIKKYYVKTTFSGTATTWHMSTSAIDGYTLHPAFVKDGVEVNQRYYGAYDASVYDVSGAAYLDGLNLDSNAANIDLTATTGDKLASVSGKFPMVGLTRNEFRKLASNVGSGWSQVDFWLANAVQLLFLMEYGSFNSQLKVGNGNVSGAYITSSSAQSDSPHTAAGASNSIGNASGNLNTSPRVNQQDFSSYRGIENFWGNCWNWIDGANIVDAKMYVSNTRPFVDDTISGYSLLGVTLPLVNGYVRDLQDLSVGFLPSLTSGGGSSTYVTDYFYAPPASSNRVLSLGGVANNGSVAGAFFLDGGNSSGIRSRSFGARLSL